MTRIINILTSTAFLLPLVVVAALYYASREKPNHQFNSFDRTFFPVTLVVRDTLNIQYNSYYIAGHTDHSLYLGNLTNPVHAIRIAGNLRDTTHYYFRFPSFRYQSVVLQVDSPYYFLTDGTMPFIYRGRLDSQ